MAKHNVYVTLPNAELGNSDAVIDVYQNGKKFGSITYPKDQLNGIQTAPNNPIR